MKILHLDSSALGGHSVTRELSAAVVAGLQTEHGNIDISYRDLDSNPVPHLTGEALAKVDAAAAEAAEQVLQQFLDSDVLVIGAPMYNFGIPSTLKAWIDRIAVAGRTFRYTETGPVGLAGGKQVIIASGRGSIFGENNAADFQEAYLRQVFAFLGISDVRFVRAEGVGYSPKHRSDAIAGALAAIPNVLPHAA